MLYEGFIDNNDRSLCEQVVEAEPASLWVAQTLLFRTDVFQNYYSLPARNYPDTLSPEEAAQWREHCQQQWQEGSFTLIQFEQEMAEERARPGAATPRSPHWIHWRIGWVLSAQG